MDLLSEKQYLTPFVLSPLLPLLLISLSRQRHSPKTASRILTEYDYVIIGAGSAGSVLAGRLSEVTCVSILLLEAGKPPPRLTDVPGIGASFYTSDIDWQYRSVPQKNTAAYHVNREILLSSGKTIGGSSVINAMLAVRGNRRNYDDWADQGADGWSYKDVESYFMKLEDNRDPNIAQNGYHAVKGPVTIERHPYEPKIKRPLMESARYLGYNFVDSNGPVQTGIFDFQSTTRGYQRCSSAKAYLVPAENRTNLDILPYAMVRKILIKNRRAIGVKFDFKGKTHEVKARREVILSAGAFGSPQLLMLSGIGPRNELEKFKIPVVADLPVGLNLQDHVGAPVLFVLDKKRISSIVVRFLNPVSLLQYIGNRTGPLSGPNGCTLIAFLNNEGVNPIEDFPDYQLYIVEAPIALIPPVLRIYPDVFKRLVWPYIFSPNYMCLSQSLHPKSRGTVRLRSTDPYDLPLIDPNYFGDPADLEDVVNGMKTCLKWGTSPPMQKVGSKPFETVYPGCEHYVQYSDDYLRCMARAFVISAYHKCCTAKMGRQHDPTTVVDSKLRVKTVKGLRVVDASVMPTIPTGNTNLPVMMIAEKASDMIKATISCDKISKGQAGILIRRKIDPIFTDQYFSNVSFAVPSRFRIHSVLDHPLHERTQSRILIPDTST